MRVPWTIGTVGKSQGSSCQSPRTQRCCRRKSASNRVGYSSKQLDVGHCPDAGEATFDQVVTEDVIRGESVGHGGGKRIDVVDSLAGEIGFAEQILIDVGYCRAIRIEPAAIGENAGVKRERLALARLTLTRGCSTP